MQWCTPKKKYTVYFAHLKRQHQVPRGKVINTVTECLERVRLECSDLIVSKHFATTELYNSHGQQSGLYGLKINELIKWKIS